MEHTKGPWILNENGNIWGNNESRYICRGHCFRSDECEHHEEERANAQLIAAAPDLYRGCLAALAYLAHPQSKFESNRKDAINIIKAAIVKAEGRE